MGGARCAITHFEIGLIAAKPPANIPGVLVNFEDLLQVSAQGRD